MPLTERQLPLVEQVEELVGQVDSGMITEYQFAHQVATLVYRWLNHSPEAKEALSKER